MKKQSYDFYRYNFAFLQKYKELFVNKVPAIASIQDYFKAWGYSPLEAPLLSMHANYGVFKPDILLRYKESSLFYLYDEKEFGFTFVHNLGNHIHVYFYVRNVPSSLEVDIPRFTVSPVIYTDHPDKAIAFLNDNADLLIKPDRPISAAKGFGMIPEPAEDEINWAEKV